MDGKLVIGTELNTDMIDKQIYLLQDKLEGLVEEYEILEKTEPFEGQNRELIKLGNEIDTTRKKLSKLVAEKEGMGKIDLSSISKGLGDVVKKVTRWGLAVFGIRSAYMAVRNAINVISQDDEQLKADIDYMKNVMAYILEPVVRKIVELAKQLVFYIGYLIKAWTGHDIFASANKNLKKSVGSAKELNKQLAGFDEMNILSDNSSASGGGGGVLPNFNFNDMKVPKWLEWMGKNAKKVLLAVAGVFLALKGIKKLGLGVALYGVYTTIKGIIDFIKDPTIDNFLKILEGISITLVGIGTFIGSVPLIVAGAIALIITYLVKNFDKIMDMFQKLKAWMDKNILGWLKEHFGKVGEFLYIPIKTAIVIIEDLFEGLIGGIKKIIEGIVKIFKGDFVGGLKDIFGGLLSIILAPFRAWYDTVKTWLYGILDLLGLIKQKQGSIGGGGSGSYGGGGSGGGRAKGGIFYPSKLPKLAIGGIINQPGRGVPYHGATIGERGAEAVVPLTDSQQMALLGEAIGRYVNIQANIPVYVGNRMVAREIKRINAEDDFAFNR